MLDSTLRPKIDPALNAGARWLAARGFSANGVTTLGLALGILAAAAIAVHAQWLGLGLLLASRLCDGLDGAVARINDSKNTASKNGSSDFGGYIDIVFDFIFYGIIPLAFVVADPAQNAVAGAVLIFSFYVNGASFLALAIMAEKRGLKTDQRGQKSIFFTTGLAEATETIAAFAAFCLFPSYFAVLAYGFAAVCFYTAAVRIWQTKWMLQ